MAPSNPFFALSFIRRFSPRRKTTPSSPPKLKNISNRYHRPPAIAAAKLALIDYLQSTRWLPSSLSHQIISNSPFSLSSFLSLVPFPSSSAPSNFPSSSAPSNFPFLIRRFLSYHPIDEFLFFYESIGLSPPPVTRKNSLFLSDDSSLLSSVHAFIYYGFPFRKLGLVHAYFEQDADELSSRLKRFEELGFRRPCVAGACLAFPWVLKSDVEKEAALLFNDLSSFLLDCRSNDAEVVFETCGKLKVFYENAMERKCRVFVEAREEVMRQKLMMREEESQMFVLTRVDVMDIELGRLEVVIPDVLMKVLDLDEEEIERIRKMYPHVIGRNVVGNFMGILKAIDLNTRFKDKILNMDLHCLKVLSSETTIKLCPNDVDKKIEQLDDMFDFLSSVGFGRNNITLKVASAIHGTRDKLQDRFDCLVGLGIGHGEVCRMISTSPRILNQSVDLIRGKVSYLCDELGYPVDYLKKFPAYLCYDLEKRIKPRNNIMNWLKENGLVKKEGSFSVLISDAEKRFIKYLYRIHRAAPKQWLETFSAMK